MAIPKVVVPVTDDEHNDLKLCLAYAAKLAKDPQNKISQVIFFVASKQQLTHNNLAAYIGEAAVKTLANNGSIPFTGQIPMRAATQRTLSFVPNGTLILAFWAGADMMDQVDALGNVAAVVAYPWPEKGLDAWIATWNPMVHGQTQVKAEPLITDPIVEAALRGMTTIMNLSNTGLVTRYKESADRMLRILRAKNHQIEPDKIRQWAVRNKWQPGAADDLAKLASKIAGLKSKPSIRSIDNGDGTYQHWQQSALPPA